MFYDYIKINKSMYKIIILYIYMWPSSRLPGFNQNNIRALRKLYTMRILGNLNRAFLFEGLNRTLTTIANDMKKLEKNARLRRLKIIGEFRGVTHKLTDAIRNRRGKLPIGEKSPYNRAVIVLIKGLSVLQEVKVKDLKHL